MIEHDINRQEIADDELAEKKGACQSCTCETASGGFKPVVSKRTKLLFIGFGAVGIAAIAIVWGPDFDKNYAAKAQAPRAKSSLTTPAPAKATH